MLELEEIHTKYETMSKNSLPEDIKTVIMVELCTPELREHLEFNATDNDYKETREAVMAHVQRERRDPIIAMEIDNYEGETQEHWGDWWSGTHDHGWSNDDSNEHEINYNGNVAKGKGGGILQKGKGKGKGAAKGGGKFDGYAKGGGKDNGKGKMEKVATCVDSGTTLPTSVKRKTLTWIGFVAWQRHSAQQPEGGLPVSDEQRSGRRMEDSWRKLKGPACFVDVCNVNKNEVVLQNRFHVLSDTEEDEQNLESGSSDWTGCQNSQKKVANQSSRQEEKGAAQLSVRWSVLGAHNRLRCWRERHEGENGTMRHSDEQVASVFYTTANGDQTVERKSYTWSPKKETPRR